MNLVQVLQGEGGTIQELLSNTASLTNSLADRDELIGQVVNNLTQTLDTVDQRHQELNTLVSELQRWMADLARDRNTIGSSLDNISDLTVVVADLLREGRPIVKSDVAKLKQLAKLLNKPKNQQQIIELLDRLPESMTDQTRTGTYGSWYSYYVCGFSGRITLPGNLGTIPGLQQVLDGLGNLNFHSTAPRCNGADETPVERGCRVKRYTEPQLLRLGAITLVVMLLVMAASFNLSKFPGFGGDSYQAYFADASGLHRGNMVQVGGIRAGRVQDVELDNGKVLVTFEVDHGVEFGKDSKASVEVLNLLGEKYLNLVPAGSGQLDEDTPIPVDRTSSSYDIVGVFGDLTETTEQIDTDQLDQALNVVSDTVNQSAPEIQASFEGIARLSQSVASRDAQIQHLLQSSRDVSTLLADRSTDLVDLMQNSSLVFEEVERRKQAIHLLLVNARELAIQLRGVATDNQAQIKPALKEVDDLLSLLNSKDKELKATLNALGPYASILGNIIGTGPWFDAYAVNLAAIPTGEFLPGPPD